MDRRTRFGNEVGGGFLIPQLCHGLVENLLIGLVAEVGDEAALLGTQQIAGTTDVEVLHGDVDAAAQVGEILQSLQPSAAVRGQGCQRRCEQITESLAVAAPHTATHLVQVGEAEILGTIYYNGIGIGDVDAVLHDGGGEQHVVVVVGEVEHDLLQFLGLHLAVANSDATVGDILQYHLLQVGQVADAVVHEVDLSVAAHLEVDGVDDNLGREGVNLGLYGVAVGRRCLDDTHVAGSDEREL